MHERRAHGSGPSFVLTPERNVSFAGLRGCGSLKSTKEDPSFRLSERGELDFCLIPPAEAGRSSSSTCCLRSRRASLCRRSSRGVGGGGVRSAGSCQGSETDIRVRLDAYRWRAGIITWRGRGVEGDDLGSQCSLNVALRSVSRWERTMLTGFLVRPCCPHCEALLVEEKVATRRHGGRPESRARRRHAASEQPTGVLAQEGALTSERVALSPGPSLPAIVSHPQRLDRRC